MLEAGNLPDAEELTGSSTESDVGALVVVDGSLGKHGVVLDLRLAGGGVLAEMSTSLALPERMFLESALKAEGDLPDLMTSWSLV